MKAWIARDGNGDIYLYNTKPSKHSVRPCWLNAEDKYFKMDESDLPEGINPQWSDDEPIEVELKIEKI